MDLTADFFYYIILKCTIIEKYALFDLRAVFFLKTYMHISINSEKKSSTFFTAFTVQAPAGKKGGDFSKEDF